MTNNTGTGIPEFAVLGHPNEGKSSVVSTLTEDDQIRVSPVPGETTRSSAYTVKIDGKAIVRFVDTPGFQVPQQTLAWFRNFKGDPAAIVSQFIREHESDPFFLDECELFRPVSEGAGIIYVVDGSRPVRDDDLAEIEILRLTGRPRMAVINSKTDQKDYSADWKHEFSKSFNAIRIFNSNTAGFSERIAMLESLKPIDQEWEKSLARVIDAFVADWHRRCQAAAARICTFIEKSLGFYLSEPMPEGADEKSIHARLSKAYESEIKKMEQQTFQNIRSMFHHHLYDHRLPAWSVLSHDLFSEQTWELLGLSTRQLAGVGALAGGGLGAVLDTAAAGISFGVFTAIGSALGAGSAVWGGKKITGRKRAGFRLGGNRFTVGPNRNVQFLFILLDRALIYTCHMVTRPHGRRDPDSIEQGSNEAGKQGVTTGFSSREKKICAGFFKAVRKDLLSRDKAARKDFEALVETAITRITGQDGNGKINRKGQTDDLTR